MLLSSTNYDVFSIRLVTGFHVDVLDDKVSILQSHHIKSHLSAGCTFGILDTLRIFGLPNV